MERVAAFIEQLSSSNGSSFAVVFFLSASIRLVQLREIPARYVMPNPNWELNAIAMSLAENGAFANPYMIPTGTTAHLPPLYPAIMSFIFRVLGLTLVAGYASLLLIILASSVLYAMLPWLSENLGLGSRAGFIGGLGGAVFVEWPGHGEYLTAIALALLLIAFLRRWRHQRYSWFGSLLLGAAGGVALHLQPALVTVIAGCLLFEFCWIRMARGHGSYGAIVVLGLVLACIPWGWRNYSAFHTLFFIRSNLGLELRMGNHEGAVPTMAMMDTQGGYPHPRTHLGEARKVLEIGEIAYMREALEDARAWIEANPTPFVQLSTSRVAHLWLGPLERPATATRTTVLTILALLGLCRARRELTAPQRAALLIPLASYPLIYYFVAYMPRYRVPIDWMLFALSGLTIGELLRSRPVFAGWLGVARSR